MFTGIVEEVGKVRSIKFGEKSSEITIEANVVINGTKLGDSICTNGVCLTVTNINNETFRADIMAETLRRSNLGHLSVGSKVNLERALSLDTRLGGHIVSGHIDGVGQVTSLVKEDNSTWVTVKVFGELLRYIVEKGSITVDGISLTVAYVDSNCFKVSIIPHTGKETILLDKKVGDTVNIECDLVGKYVEKLLGITNVSKRSLESSINEKFLRDNGFL